MSILDMQRRMTQLGEIRIGHVVDTGRTSDRTGKSILRPEKLDRFRFTSPSKERLDAVAALYGGDVERWTPQNGDPDEWQVTTTTDRVAVIVPPDAVSQWYELWKGSRCVRRCDGRMEQKNDTPCVCDPDPKRRDCSITTRVNLMLRDLPGIGVWLLTTHGWYAGTELPAMADLLSRGGGWVPGVLTLEEKKVPAPREGDPPRRFMVPKLEAEITPGALLSSGGSPQLPAPTNYAALAASATTRAEVLAVWQQAAQDGRLDDGLKAELTRIGTSLPEAPALPETPGGGQ